MIKLLVCVTCLFITIDVVLSTHYMYTFNPGLLGWVALHMVPASWKEAALTCHFEGATLASPIDKNMSKVLEEVILSELEMGQQIFVGTHNLYFNNVFLSLEGIPLANMPVRRHYNNRQENEIFIRFSNTDEEKCLTMRYEAGELDLYTSSCTEKYPYVCYKKYNNETANQCGTFDKNYRFNENTGSCYKLHQNTYTWYRANMICAAEGGYLVILNNAEEAKFVKEMSPNDMHIGLQAWTSDRIWLTVQGESFESVYNSWAGNQPSNNGYPCAVLSGDGTLDQTSCDTRAIFVCEKDPSRLMFQTV